MIINRDCSVEGAFAGISLDSVSHRVTPHHDAGSRKVPLVGIAFAGISGFRIKCGMTGRVFLDSASHRVTPHYDAGSIGGYYLCQYSWIPHQVRNDVKHRVVARYDVVGIPGFRIKCGMTCECDMTRNSGMP